MKTGSLWTRMWAQSEFVPAHPTSKIDQLMGEETVMDKVSKLERRVQVLENRLSRLGKI